MKFSFVTKFITLCLFVMTVFSKTAEEWKSRSVYQIITDRFARTDGDTAECSDLGKYCGGTFKGIQNNLDYIQGMGFNAIWISPVVANTPDGYHGYWVNNIYEINEYFGTPEELKELIQTCHERDIWVMVDVVANHIGYVDNNDYSSIVPFNDSKHYNPYLPCEDVDPMNTTAFESCWLSGLPDLDQNNPFVKETLINWIADFVKTYDFDALRIDTVPHVSRSFWAEFGEASGVYTLGEILNTNLPLLATYQGALDGVLNYALYATLNYAFQAGESMSSIQGYYAGAEATWPDMTLLGNFINNHDNPRFLSNSTNIEAFKSALAFSMCSVGIPMVYYGDEHAFSGGQDPANRETLWNDMNTDSEIYDYLRTLNKIRKDTGFYELDQIERYSDDTMYAFSRGDILFAFTNRHDPQVKTISDHPYSEGTVLCNVLRGEGDGDCVDVKDGKFDVTLLDGEVKILAPRQKDESPLAGSEGEKGLRAKLAEWTNIPLLESTGSYYTSSS